MLRVIIVFHRLTFVEKEAAATDLYAEFSQAIHYPMNIVRGKLFHRLSSQCGK